MKTTDTNANAIPPIQPWLVGSTRWFVPRYLRKHFHCVAANHQALTQSDIRTDDRLVVYANHASWWDPLIALYCGDQFFRGYKVYAPIDALALEKYRILARMGFFPVRRNSRDGAAAFLGTSLSILSQPGSSIWMTPEGRFTDVRDLAAGFQPGLGHLAAAVNRHLPGVRVWLIPVAVEYVFWEERLPEVLVWFGQPACCQETPQRSKAEWSEFVLDQLRASQAALAAASITRDTSQFRVALSGHRGAYGPYDFWRKWSTALRGRRMDLQHGQKLTSEREP